MNTMTGAELQTMREACGLSRDELSTFTGVQARTVKYWENGRAGVPADVADLIRKMDSSVQMSVNELIHSIRNKPPVDIVFIRYKNEDIEHYRPDLGRLMAGVHGAILNRVRLILPWRAGHLDRIPSIRIVWMVPDEYEAWRGARTDTEAVRSEWAAGQVERQAMNRISGINPAHVILDGLPPV